MYKKRTYKKRTYKKRTDPTEQGEVGWANVWKTQTGAVRSLTNICSLVHYTLHILVKNISKVTRELRALDPLLFSQPWISITHKGGVIFEKKRSFGKDPDSKIN